jgi:hypothetical protein
MNNIKTIYLFTVGMVLAMLSCLLICIVGEETKNN